MKVLVVSEGKHELGPIAESSSLIALVRRMLPRATSFHCEKVRDPKVHAHFTKGKSVEYEKRALAWMRFAQQRGFNAIVVVVDQDRKNERVKGFTIAQESLVFVIPRAFGVAIDTYDAWMLADETALARAMSTSVSRQKAPEQIRQPKQQAQRLCEESGFSTGLAELYLSVAQCVDLDVLEDRCPRGFGVFRQRVASIGPADSSMSP